jgi:hypothetical protein
MPSTTRRALGLPSRIAMVLGLGAMSVAGANAAPAAEYVPQQSAKSFGDLRIWLDGERLFVAEPGQPARELRLGDTAEARALRETLAQAGATADQPFELRDRLILVGGGGAGTHWSPQDKPALPDNSTAPLKSAKPPMPPSPHQGTNSTTASQSPTNLAGAEQKQPQ